MALRQRLETQSKEELLELRRIFSVDIPSSAKKAKLIDAISEKILGDPGDILNGLPEYELRHIQTLCHLPEGGKMTFEIPFTPFFLALLGVVSSEQLDDHKMTLSLDKELRAVFGSCIDEIISEHESKGSFRLDHIFFGMLCTYGVVDPMALFKVIESENSEEQVRIMIDRLSDFPPLGFNKTGKWLCHPALYGPEGVLEERGSRGFTEDKLKPYPADYFASVGESAPYFAADLDAPHGKKLITVLKEIGFEDSFPVLMSDIWIQCQMRDNAKSLNEMVKGIMQRGCFDSMDQAEEFISAISAYSNNIPKWSLGGRSSDEVFRSDPAASSIAANVAATADRLSGIYGEASQFKGVGRNDPCPCGSGLKYKNCHGKNLN